MITQHKTFSLGYIIIKKTLFLRPPKTVELRHKQILVLKIHIRVQHVGFKLHSKLKPFDVMLIRILINVSVFWSVSQ